jgi:hypothetical protein
MTMITPVSTRIEDILNAPTQYANPMYQRDFKWGKTEAQELVEDLNNYQDTDSEHLFLGNFIFEPSRDQRTHVIDGQQRLTTLILLLIACRMHARKLGLPHLESAIQGKLTFIDATTAQSQGCRLIASESVRDVFEYMANGDWQGDFPTRLGRRQVKRQGNRLRPIYIYFLSQLDSFSQQELSLFLRALYNAYVFRVSIINDEEALSIFERTNARGMDLEVADLLKNYLFSRRVESIEERWKEIINNSEGTILRMLKYFFVSKLGYVMKPQLYRRLKEYGDRNDVGSEQLTTSLAEFSKFYSLTKNPTRERTREYFEAIGFDAIFRREDRSDAIAASLQALQEFGVVQFCPVAYAAIELARRTAVGNPDVNAKTLIRLFGSLEKYHFVNNIVCERVGNEVERLYADTCQALVQESDLPRAVNAFIISLREKRARWDEFRSRFVEITYSSDNLAIICYIFDRLNNHGLDPAQRLAIYNPDTRLLRRNNNIEHFLPQTPPAEIEIDEETTESIDNIGNLLPIYFRTNSRLGNLPPAEKVRRLRGNLRNEIQNLPFVQEFIDQYGRFAETWNAIAIQTRAGDLADRSFRRVWALD